MIAPPDTLIAELTYRCPLRCGYCSNPLMATGATLSTAAWCALIEEAEALGVLQLHLTGGEPLLRDDLETIVRVARARALYVNLITSGLPLRRERLIALVEAGVDHVQLSMQAANEPACDALAGTTSWRQKLDVARWVKSLDVPLTLNVVLHHHNIDDVEAIIALAEALGADRLELANTQYLGWALANRAALLPTRAQLERAHAAAMKAKQRMDVVFVLPDYFAGRPRACMSGWAQRYLVVTPDGRVMPCQAAHALPLEWERVGTRPLADLWRTSPALTRFRGFLPEACRDCDERGKDLGGCRCQAFLLGGDAEAMDPACAKGATHELVELASRAPDDAIPYRRLKLV